MSPDPSHKVTLRDYNFLYLFLIASRAHKVDAVAAAAAVVMVGGGGNRRPGPLRHRPDSAPHVVKATRRTWE